MASISETLCAIEQRAERAIVQELRLMVQEILVLRPSLGLEDRSHADALLLKLDRLEASQQVASAQDIAAPILLMPDLQLPAAEPNRKGYAVTLYGIDRDAADCTEIATSIEAALRLLAQRLLDRIGATPASHGPLAIPVTASIGFASFPMAPNGSALDWERAIDLVDTVMYLAKAHGRNKAYGIASMSAQGREALLALQGRLEAAWQAGQVQLLALQGPVQEAKA